MYYYANTFYYYKMREGERISFHYTGGTLYKSKEEATKNAEREWLEIADDNEILDYTLTKLMALWKDKEEQESNTEK